MASRVAGASSPSLTASRFAPGPSLRSSSEADDRDDASSSLLHPGGRGLPVSRSLSVAFSRLVRRRAFASVARLRPSGSTFFSSALQRRRRSVRTSLPRRTASLRCRTRQLKFTWSRYRPPSRARSAAPRAPASSDPASTAASTASAAAACAPSASLPRTAAAASNRPSAAAAGSGARGVLSTTCSTRATGGGGSAAPVSTPKARLATSARLR